MAGVERFELSNEGVKVPCLTTWLYPNIKKAVLFGDFRTANSTGTFNFRLLYPTTADLGLMSPIRLRIINFLIWVVRHASTHNTSHYKKYINRFESSFVGLGFNQLGGLLPQSFVYFGSQPHVSLQLPL